jgi:hypothetical protein
MDPSLVSDEPCCSRNCRDNPERWPTNGASNHRHFWFPLLFGQIFLIPATSSPRKKRDRQRLRIPGVNQPAIAVPRVLTKPLEIFLEQWWQAR